METIDDEILEHALDFFDRQADADAPFFCWFNTTHSHPKPESVGQAGLWQSPYHDTMIDHDKVVGAVPDKLDELGLAENTIVIYSTENWPHMNTWPDGGMTPFRSEKNTNWEGAFRVPEMIRWPGKIPAGTVSNEIVQHHDWLPTFLAAAGEPDIVEKLKAVHTIGDTTFKVHIDGYNLLPYLTGEADRSPRKGLVYFSDDGDVLALRFDNWKVVFMEQRVQGTLQIWAEPFVALRVPKLFNLRTDPFERADITSNTYYAWLLDSDYIILAASTLVAEFLATFQEFTTPEGRELHDRPGGRQAGERADLGTMTNGAPAPGMARVPAATFRMGLDAHYPEEAPAHPVTVGAFWIDRRAVTNREFAAFVAETGYVTVAERPMDPTDFPGAPAGNLVPGSLVFTRTPGPVNLRHVSQGWTWTPGACWARPEGPGSSPAGRADHPVAHVAFENATPRGPARRCPARPNGSSPRAAGSTVRRTRGATSPSRRGSRGPTSGTASSPGGLTPATARRRPSPPTPRTAMACST
jgi:hypothetical protein